MSDRRQAPEPSSNPWIGWLGWCHACETFQKGSDARWLPMFWSSRDDHTDWACVYCPDEPWGYGVWAEVCPQCADLPVSRPLAKAAARLRSGYPDDSIHRCEHAMYAPSGKPRNTTEA